MSKEIVVSSEGAIGPVVNWLNNFIRSHISGGAIFISLSRESVQDLRTGKQNRLMWPLLTDVSKQVTHLDGKKYKPDDWKDLLTCGFEEVMRYAPNLDGTGMIAFGARTSKYKKKKMIDFIEYIYAEGSIRGVIWSDDSNKTLEEVRS